MDLLKFFIENNNSGAKTKESFLKKNYPELYLDIINYTNNDLINLPFIQKIPKVGFRDFNNFSIYFGLFLIIHILYIT